MILDFKIYIGEQRMLRRASTSAKSGQRHRCSYTQNMVADEDSDQILANTNNIIKMVTIKIVDEPLR